MYFTESVRSGFQNIFSHKLRSFLTLLGIIIGVFAVVTMFSSVYGLKKLINDKMEGLGFNNSIIIYPSSGDNELQSRRMRHFRFRYIRREAKPLTFSDYTMLRSEVDTKYIYGMVENWKKFMNGDQKEWVNLRATNNELFESQTYPLKSGRYFNAYEVRNALKVCVIGYHFADKYFKGKEPVGEIITVGDIRYKIIGVLDQDVLNQNGMNFNTWQRQQDLKAVYIPLSTGSLYLRSGNAIDYIYLQAWNDKVFPQMKTTAQQQLLAKHKMAHDFTFNDVGAMIFQITEEINEMMKKWNITLSAITSISLIVGGIGLFSILLISINERMMEIGIRKSLGATEKDIFLLFLIESVILALIAALFGVFASTFVVKAISIALKAEFPVPVQGILLGLGFSVLVGIISGLYPALKASRIDPIKAIYYTE